MTARSPSGPSPCNSVCRMDPSTGWCLGCLRTLDEIATWSTLADDAKQVVWRLLEQRRADLLPRQPERGSP